MTTALHMINRAFSKAQIKPAETPLTASEVSDGLDVMNDLLAHWDATGTLKGVPLMDDVNDTVDCPRYAERAIKASIAVMIAGEYNVPVTQAMAVDVSDGLAAMIAAGGSLSIDIEFPDTLPRGSGNRDDYYTYVDEDFFPNNTKLNF
jgi:hypothetical protein